MTYTVVTLSSIGTSNPVVLNHSLCGPTVCFVTLGSTTMTTNFYVQYTIDDLNTSSNPFWAGYSSAVSAVGYSTLAATRYTSASADNGVFMSFPFPLGGVRLNSTAISSNTLRMRVMQAENW